MQVLNLLMFMFQINLNMRPKHLKILKNNNNSKNIGLILKIHFEFVNLLIKLSPINQKYI